VINLNIDLDQKDLQRFLNAAPRTIFNAQRSAIRTTTTFADKLLKDRMALATGLPGKVFKKFRVVKRSSDSRGVIFLGMNPVKAAFAGKLTQEPGGASAGQYYWAGGFVATMRSGHVSIFKRKGSQRLPLVEQVVELPQAEAIAGQVADETAAELQRRYLEKLEASLR
jgi:hypothetical protein